jgi:hypothetical protein
LEFKILGLVYIQLSSFRRAARALSGVHRVSKKLWRWVRRFSGRVNVNPSRMAGRLIALDEMLINGLLGLCSSGC